MKTRKLNPYDFEYKYEYGIYERIGIKYRNIHGKRIRRWVSTIFRKLSRKKPYPILHTYSDWEEHILKKIPENKRQCKNIMHWMIEQERLEHTHLNILSTVLIPIYIALLSLLEYFGVKNLFGLISFIIVIAPVSYAILYLQTCKVEFWNDVIEIVKNKEEALCQNNNVSNAEKK